MKSKIGKPWERAKGLVGLSETKWEKNAKLKRLKKKIRKFRRKEKEKQRAERQMAAERCNRFLTGFWEFFNQAQEGERIIFLKDAAHPGWPRISFDLRVKLRKEFAHLSRHLLNIPDTHCICCDRAWVEKHHIVPLAYGGINEEINLVLICVGCHDEIHPWMKESPMGEGSPGEPD